MTTTTDTPKTGASPAFGFGGNKYLKHQLKTGRLHTKGSGTAAAEPEVEDPPRAPVTDANADPYPGGDDDYAPVQGASAPASEAATSAPAPAASNAAPTQAAPRPLGFGFGRVAQAPAEPSASKPTTAPSAAKAPAAAPAAAAPAATPVASARPAGFARAPASAPAAPAPVPAASARVAAPAPAAGFSGAVVSQRVAGSAKVHISTVKLLTRLLGAVAARPGIMAEEHVRSETLRDLHRQALELGTSLAQRCVLNGPAPDWLRAQATDAAANTICMAWEGGMSADKIKAFNESLATQLGAIAQDAEEIAGRVGFDGYAVADTVETAQARLYVSVTAAIGRLSVLGVPPVRAAQCIAEVVDHLQATENHAGLKLDLRTAWLQGSLGRCTDLVAAILQSQTLVPGGEDRLTFAQRQALSLFHEVENYAQQFNNRKPDEPIEGVPEGQESDPGSMPGAR
ncbi:hypothetical protein [Variovorax ginsengisoli]|uniref:Uncharacterized protein n=1 Tax=Variovorax ginsengisoli TaxID=363844 RepID=A0ABT8SFW4_9BURK|nr:hypothetical protein [Variovorax ginsengisoli]MDN8617206.1 hypothetical protein [Variovorax ginsengisoli]MDO1536376.1 hypothetical protein [Variovorax ginsengisoli]